MFRLFTRRKKDSSIELKEKLIAKEKARLATIVDHDVQNLRGINKALSNGVSLRMYHAAGGKRDF